MKKNKEEEIRNELVIDASLLGEDLDRNDRTVQNLLEMEMFRNWNIHLEYEVQWGHMTLIATSGSRWPGEFREVPLSGLQEAAIKVAYLAAGMR